MKKNKFKQYGEWIVVGIILIAIYKVFDISWFHCFNIRIFTDYNRGDFSVFFRTTSSSSN